MKHYLKTIFLLSIVHCIVMGTVIAQVLTNNGAQIFSNTNALIFVDGEVLNQSSGTFDNNGTIEVTGDWTNNAGNAAFVASNPGLVNLTGTAQNIRGNSVTQFNNLTLSGTGNKTQQIDARVEDTLALNDRELATDSFTMFVLSTNTGAITRTTGFVSSLDTGKLSRNTLSILTYSFPVGSSIGSPRYRPVEITPSSALAHTFTVRMANVDATSEGFDRSINDSTLCIINSDYYHRIVRTAGSNPADITIYFDDAADNNYTNITHWQNVPRWENTGAVTIISNVSPVLSSVTKSAWNDYFYTPFALGTSSPLVTLSSNDTTVCQGDSVTFTASSGFSNYDFFNNSGLVQTGPSDTFITNVLTTGDTIRVTATDTGCTAYSNEIMITVSPPPVLDATAVLIDSSSCGGSDGSVTGITVSGTSPFTYLWDDGVPTTSLNLTGVPAGSYTLTVTDSNGCSDVSGPHDVYATSAPSPPVALSDTVYCDGDVVAGLTATGSNIEWFSDAGLTISIGTGSPYTPSPIVGSNVYYVTQTVGGCQSPADSVVILINSLPLIDTTSLVIDSSSCGASDGTVTGISVSGNAPFTYLWDDGAPTTTLDLAGVPAGAYTLTVTDSNGCSDVSGPHIISDVGAPLIDISVISINPSRCDSGTGEITGITVSGGISPLTYQWDDPNSQTTLIATGLDAGSYILIVTDFNGCSSSSGPHVVLNFPTPPPPAASSPAPYCQGDVIAALTAIGTALIWYSDIALTDSISSGSPFASGAVSDTSFWVTETTNGCEGTATQVNITINSSPTAIITPSGATTFCTGDSVELVSNPAASYEWLLNGLSMGLSTQNIFASDSGNYQVVVTNGSGCSDTSFVEVVTTSPPPTAIITPANPSICNGDTVTLTASGGSSYLWNTLDTTLSIPVTPSATIIYTVTVSNGSCQDVASVTVTVNSPPVASISGITAVCSGQSGVLTASGKGAYQWSTGATDTSIIVSPLTDITYYLTVTNSCGSSVDSIEITVDSGVNALFTVDLSEGEIPLEVMFTDMSTGADSWQWDFGDGTNPSTVQNPTHTYEIEGQFDVILIVTNSTSGCTDRDSVVIIATEEKAMIVFIPDIFSPNGDGENDVLYVRGKGIASLNFLIYERWGELVFEANMDEAMNQGWDGTFNGKESSPAVFVYYLKVVFKNGEEKEQTGNITLIK